MADKDNSGKIRAVMAPPKESLKKPMEEGLIAFEVVEGERPRTYGFVTAGISAALMLVMTLLNLPSYFRDKKAHDDYYADRKAEHDAYWRDRIDNGPRVYELEDTAADTPAVRPGTMRAVPIPPEDVKKEPIRAVPVDIDALKSEPIKPKPIKPESLQEEDLIRRPAVRE